MVKQQNWSRCRICSIGDTSSAAKRTKDGGLRYLPTSPKIGAQISPIRKGLSRADLSYIRRFV